jgi:hypothetical protein
MPYISASIVVQLMGIASLFAKTSKWWWVVERLIRLHVGWQLLLL